MLPPVGCLLEWEIYSNLIMTKYLFFKMDYR